MFDPPEKSNDQPQPTATDATAAPMMTDRADAQRPAVEPAAADGLGEPAPATPVSTPGMLDRPPRPPRPPRPRATTVRPRKNGVPQACVIPEPGKPPVCGDLFRLGGARVGGRPKRGRNDGGEGNDK